MGCEYNDGCCELRWTTTNQGKWKHNSTNEGWKQGKGLLLPRVWASRGVSETFPEYFFAADAIVNVFVTAEFLNAASLDGDDVVAARKTKKITSREN